MQAEATGLREGGGGHRAGEGQSCWSIGHSSTSIFFEAVEIFLYLSRGMAWLEFCVKRIPLAVNSMNHPAMGGCSVTCDSTALAQAVFWGLFWVYFGDVWQG